MTAFLEYGFLELSFLTEAFLTEVVAGSDGMQFLQNPSNPEALGMQFQQEVDTSVSTGMQFNQNIGGIPATGIQFLQSPHMHLICPVFLVDPFLTTPFLVARICVVMGMQWTQEPVETIAVGTQYNAIIATQPASGMQFTSVILDDKPIGFQFDQRAAIAMAMQFNINLYNAKNLRIMCEFPSRGTVDNNWTASSTAAGTDFGVNNVNSDIVEKVWRSAGTGTVQLVCDTGIPQGVPIDTLSLQNSNLTTSASVSLEGSILNGPFTPGITIALQVTLNNIYYISPELPITQFRYWRLTIDDNTNPDGFYQIGTILFGSSSIFNGECFTDVLDFRLKDFNDKVRTEGFTNVANSRALKKLVGLNFRSLDSSLGNFTIIRDISETYRTTHKCLWIPTPSPTDQAITAKFALFSKLKDLPAESHKSVDDSQDYISFKINLDESL